MLWVDLAAEIISVMPRAWGSATQAQLWSLFQVVVDNHVVMHVTVSCHLLPLAKGGEAVLVLSAQEERPILAGKQSGGARDVDVVLVIQGWNVPWVQGAVLGCPDAVGAC